MNQSPLIIALDFESADQARALVRALGEDAGFYKVGLELYAAAGMDFVRELHDASKKVFLDLKFYDIGETVRRAVAQVAKTGVQFLTVHGSNTVLGAAIEGRAGAPLKLLAVTVLTSFDEEDLRDLGYPCSPADLVAHRVRNVVKVGIDGVVCSAREVRHVRTIAGPDTILVIPGVRSRGAAAGDQKRVATPSEALANGADYLVIGRQVTRAADPASALAEIVSEIHAAAPRAKVG
jgi:orotidine-5'-phosphate decarboxylase